MNNTSIIARISACNARVAAMNAGNAHSALKNKPPVYGAREFMAQAFALEELASLADSKAREFVVEDVDFDALVKPAKCTVNDSINYECQRDHGHSGPCAMRPLEVQSIQLPTHHLKDMGLCDCLRQLGHLGQCEPRNPLISCATPIRADGK